MRGGHLRTGEGSVLQNDEISGNGVGISATDNSVLDLRGSPGGEVRTLVTGNTGNGMVVAGYGLFCGDAETSVTGDYSGVFGNGQGEVSCSGFQAQSSSAYCWKTIPTCRRQGGTPTISLRPDPPAGAARAAAQP